MVRLVEDLENLPNNKITSTGVVQNLYAFALNRRNKNGDRDKALQVILKVSCHGNKSSNCDKRDSDSTYHGNRDKAVEVILKRRWIIICLLWYNETPCYFLFMSALITIGIAAWIADGDYIRHYC